MTADADTLHRFYAAINRNDMAAMSEHFAPHVVRVEPPGFPTSGTYRGVEAASDHVAAGRATWAEGACEPEAFFANGDKVVAYVHVRVRLEGAAEWLDARFADGFVFRNGKIAEFRTFARRDEALAWAGIEDREPARR